MSYLTVINCFILILVVLYLSHEKAECYEISRNQQSREMTPMWFGPRLGRRKRNQEKLYRNDKDQASIMEILKESPLVVVAINDGGKPHNFTPRLGRDSNENNPNWLDDDFPESAGSVGGGNSGTEPLSSRSSNLFAPRLGKNLSPFSPRLGREMD